MLFRGRYFKVLREYGSLENLESEVTSVNKISGAFPVICKMELISGKISGSFPVMQDKNQYFHVF
jgi:hypothetical protein